MAIPAQKRTSEIRLVDRRPILPLQEWDGGGNMSDVREISPLGQGIATHEIQPDERAPTKQPIEKIPMMMLRGRRASETKGQCQTTRRDKGDGGKRRTHDWRSELIVHTPAASQVPKRSLKSAMRVRPEMTDCSHPKRRPASWRGRREEGQTSKTNDVLVSKGTACRSSRNLRGATHRLEEAEDEGDVLGHAGQPVELEVEA